MSWYHVFQMPGLLKRFRGQDGMALMHDDVEALEKTRDNVRLDKTKGASGTEMFDGGTISTDEYNPELIGDELWDKVRIMKNSDGAIRSALQVMKLPFLRTTAKIVPEKTDTEDATDKLIAETAHAKLITNTHIHETWDEQLRNRLLMFDYGFSCEEKVHTIDDDGFLVYSRFAPRMPWSIERFKADPRSGQLRYVYQRAFKGDKQVELRMDAPRYVNVYTWDKEGDNYWGRTVLRYMYKHWWYKEELYRIDAVRLDRWGIGIPDAEVAEGKTLKPKEKTDVIRMLRQLRGNERAYILRPAEIKISILTPQGQGGALGLMESVNHHDVMIFRSILAGFMTTGNQEHGNYGSTASYTDLYLYALQSAANFLEEQYTKQVVRQFCLDNFNMTGRPFPRLKFTDIQKTDLEAISEGIARLTGAKVITPDDDLESFFRTLYGWPKLPKDFTRKAMRERMTAAGLNPDLPNGGQPQDDGSEKPGDPKKNGRGTQGKGNEGRPPKQKKGRNRSVDQTGGR